MFRGSAVNRPFHQITEKYEALGERTRIPPSNYVAPSSPHHPDAPKRLGSPYVFLATLPLLSNYPAPKKGDRPLYNEFGDWPKNLTNPRRRYISGYSVSHLYLS